MLHCLAAIIKNSKKMALVGFNGIGIGQALPIPLTNVEVSRFKMGKETAKALLALRDGEKIPAINDLGFNLIIGKSS